MGCIGALIYLGVLCMISEEFENWMIFNIGILIPIVVVIVQNKKYHSTTYYKVMELKRQKETDRHRNSWEISRIICTYIDEIGGFKEISSRKNNQQRYDLTILSNSGETHTFSFGKYGYDYPSEKTISEIYKYLIKHYKALECHSYRQYGGIVSGYSVSSSGNISPNTTSGECIEVYRICSKKYEEENFKKLVDNYESRDKKIL